MGRTFAEDLNHFIGGDTAISIHFQSNCYPPIPQFFVPAARDAIAAGNDRDWDRLIDLPEQVEWKDGRRAVEAHLLIEQFRLDGFIECEEE